MHFALVLSQAFKDFFPSVRKLFKTILLRVANEALGRRYPRLYLYSDIPRPSAPLCHCIFRYPGSFLVIWTIPGVVLAYCCLHPDLYGRCDFDDLHPQRGGAVLRSNSVVLRPICWPQCMLNLCI